MNKPFIIRKLIVLPKQTVINIHSTYINWIRVQIIFSLSQLDSFFPPQIYLQIWQRIQCWKLSFQKTLLEDMYFYYYLDCWNFKTVRIYPCYRVNFIKYLIILVSTHMDKIDCMSTWIKHLKQQKQHLHATQEPYWLIHKVYFFKDYKIFSHIFGRIQIWIIMIEI